MFNYFLQDSSGVGSWLLILGLRTICSLWVIIYLVISSYYHQYNLWKFILQLLKFLPVFLTLFCTFNVIFLIFLHIHFLWSSDIFFFLLLPLVSHTNFLIFDKYFWLFTGLNFIVIIFRLTSPLAWGETGNGLPNNYFYHQCFISFLFVNIFNVAAHRFCDLIEAFTISITKLMGTIKKAQFYHGLSICISII
jgi:hypothetical protein